MAFSGSNINGFLRLSRSHTTNVTRTSYEKLVQHFELLRPALFRKICQDKNLKQLPQEVIQSNLK